ncbi:MAG: cysteine desulfurase [Planctomycetes bacterium]|nr:cysteine desulfurase [Planctomycetota bacterium]
MKRVYLDHNSTTPLRAEVRELLFATLDELGGNPSSVHASGRRARHLLDQARERAAAALGVHEDELIFTSGGTESNNLALHGVLAAAKPGAGLVTTAIEHSSVLEPAEALARGGRLVEFVGVDRAGRLDPDLVVARAAACSAALVSVMTANNEVGMLLPVAEIARTKARAWRFHTDAVQALGRVELRLAEWGIDLASFSMHKLGGPVGVGVLYHRKGVDLAPLARGGGQEGGLRPGTENVAGIVASALALELAVRERAELAQRLARLSQSLWSELHAALPHLQLVGPALEGDARLPGTLNLLAAHVDGKVLVTRLDLAGLEVSAGSACASGSLEPSHVLLALGFTRDEARAALRLSLGRSTSSEDVHNVVETLRKILG